MFKGVIGLAAILAFNGMPVGGYSTAVKQENSINVSQQVDEKLVMPQTRTESEVVKKAIELGYYVPNEKYNLQTLTKELQNTNCTRAEYARIFSKMADYAKIEKVPCCMGNSPDLSELKGTEWYKNVVTKAAQDGYLCTREGLRAEEDLKVRELDLFTYKLIKTFEYSESNPLTVEQFKVSFKDAEDETAQQVEILSYLLDRNALIRTTTDRLMLDESATIYEVLMQAVNITDQKVIYNKVEKSKKPGEDSVCLPCLTLSVDSWYEDK